MTETMNDTRRVERSVPRHYSFSKPYWEATRDKKLLLQFCPRSGKYQFYPRPASLFTGRRDLEWREASGRGEVFAFTVARIGRAPFGGETPYVVATITLEEGVNVVANLVDCPREKLATGLKVKASWIGLPDDTQLLVFTPADSDI